MKQREVKWSEVSAWGLRSGHQRNGPREERGTHRGVMGVLGDGGGEGQGEWRQSQQSHDFVMHQGRSA